MFGWAAAKAGCKRPANNIATNLVTKKSTHPLKTRDPSGGDPFGNEDVALIVKTGVVRVDELAINPGLGVAAIDLLLLHHPFNIITQPGDDLVLFIEQGHARV